MRAAVLAMGVVLVSAPVMAQSTYAAADCTQAAVNTAVGMATNGDTVTIPACSMGETWTTGLTVSVGITLQGAGTGQTVLIQNFAGRMIVFNTVASQTTRMTGIEIRMASGAVGGGAGGVIELNCGSNTDSHQIRIDNNRFETGDNSLNDFVLFPYNCIGVIDNNYFEMQPNDQGAYGWHGSWDGDTYGQGDGSWLVDCDWGSANFLFVEDNTFEFLSGNFSMWDGVAGMRVVLRYNTILDGRMTGHGTESSARSRGTRCMEVYNNTFTGGGVITSEYVTIRSGSALVYDNTGSGYGATPAAASLQCYRMLTNGFGSFCPDDADGACGFDVNDASTTSWTSTGGGTNSCTIAGTPWTTDQWVGYTVKNITTDLHGVVSSNTNNTATITAGGFGTDIVCNNNDSMEFRLVNFAMDMPGSGETGMDGGDPADNTTPTPISLNQDVEAIYAWDNTHGATSLTVDNGCPASDEDTHWFDDGTEAPGYTPYTYPHPLRGAISAGNPVFRIRTRDDE